MTHPDPGAASASSPPAEAGEWILARILADAIAAAIAGGAQVVREQYTVDQVADLTHPPIPADVLRWVDVEVAGRAAAAALRFVTTTADLFEDRPGDGVPLFAIAAQLPADLAAAPDSPSLVAATPEGPGRPAPGPSGRLDLISRIREELAASPAFPTSRRRRAFVAGYLRPRGARILRQATDEQLEDLLAQIGQLTDLWVDARRRA